MLSQIEGIGGQEVPQNLNRSVLDDFMVVTDEEAFLMAREMSVKEGLLCGNDNFILQFGPNETDIITSI